MTDDTRFFGHPRGLSTLFFTEMWERFSYYGMRAILILFMVAPPATGGMGFDTATAGAVFGLYTSMVYMTGLPGGWLADQWLGARRAVLIGGILIAAGHFSMAVQSTGMFYLGLLLIVLGTGLLKGNVSVIVGRLYSADDVRRDAGYSIFYMGINLGAFVAPLVCGYLGLRVSWHAGFAAAGVGMLLGLVQYVIGSKHLGTAGLLPADAGSAAANSRQRQRAIRWTATGGGIIVAVVALVAMGVIAPSPVLVADIAGYGLLAITGAFFGWLFFSPGWTPQERGRLYVIGVLFLGAALFWSAFEQAGSTLTLFADRNTENTLFGWSFLSTYYQSLNPVFLILLAPVFAWAWVALAHRKAEPSSPAKFGVGLALVGAGFVVMAVGAALGAQGGKVSPWWLIATYLLHTAGELTLSPVGLSAMSKLAPVRIGGLVMGVWFLASSVGNYIGGRLAGFYESWTLTQLFGVVAAYAIGAGLVLLLIARPLDRLTSADAPP